MRSRSEAPSKRREVVEPVRRFGLIDASDAENSIDILQVAYLDRLLFTDADVRDSYHTGQPSRTNPWSGAHDLPLPSAS